MLSDKTTTFDTKVDDYLLWKLKNAAIFNLNTWGPLRPSFQLTATWYISLQIYFKQIIILEQIMVYRKNVEFSVQIVGL